MMRIRVRFINLFANIFFFFLSSNSKMQIFSLRIVAYSSVAHMNLVVSFLLYFMYPSFVDFAAVVAEGAIAVIATP